jgi:hypothetical protein
MKTFIYGAIAALMLTSAASAASIIDRDPTTLSTGSKDASQTVGSCITKTVSGVPLAAPVCLFGSLSTHEGPNAAGCFVSYSDGSTATVARECSSL